MKKILFIIAIAMTLFTGCFLEDHVTIAPVPPPSRVVVYPYGYPYISYPYYTRPPYAAPRPPHQPRPGVNPQHGPNGRPSNPNNRPPRPDMGPVPSQPRPNGGGAPTRTNYGHR